MKKLNVLFQMDPLKRLNQDIDSTCKIAREAILRGHQVFFTEAKNVYFLINKVFVKCSYFQLKKNNFLVTGNKQISLDLCEFDIVFIRQDPPFNMDYISNTYIHDLRKLTSKAPLFINDPNGIRNFTEKLYPLHFNNIIPDTAITCDKEDILKLISNYKRVVLKPLYDRAGNGVTLINNDDKYLLDKIKKLTKGFRERIVVQEFLKNVSKGDKRILLLNGNPLGAINRIPQKNTFKANLHLGAQAKKAVITKSDKKICEILKPSLIENGLFFVGLDVIDEKLTEINVTSPTGIHHLNILDKKKIEKKIWSVIEKEVSC